MVGRSPVSFRWDVIASGDDGPGPRSRHGLAYDRGEAATVLFGGIIWDGVPTLCSDSWELRDGRWSRVEVPKSPAARHRGAMVYDAVRGNVVLFGGQGVTNAMLGGTWVFERGKWQKRRTGWWWNRPAPRCGHALAFDEEAGVTVLFGGIGSGDRALGDTWLFDGGSWKPVAGRGPPYRRYAAFAYDPDLKGCVLHGGAVDDRGRKCFGDTWLFRERTWTRLADGFDTDIRDDHGLAYHPAAKRLVMLEGVAGARGILVREADGWRSAGVVELHPRHQCSPLAWDARLTGLVLHGGERHHAGPQLDETRVLRLSA
jgi:hypothetical protein